MEQIKEYPDVLFNQLIILIINLTIKLFFHCLDVITLIIINVYCDISVYDVSVYCDIKVAFQFCR